MTGGIDTAIREAIREVIRAELLAELQQLRAELAELKSGPPAELRGMLTLQQLADFLEVSSQQTARKWCHQNKVKLRKVAGATRVLGEDVHRVLKKD